MLLYIVPNFSIVLLSCPFAFIHPVCFFCLFFVCALPFFHIWLSDPILHKEKNVRGAVSQSVPLFGNTITVGNRLRSLGSG
jgi:hypothetical protein